MFAGGRRRSSNVRAMQLFHELKQQFPTVPDNVVQACIAKYILNSSNNSGSSNEECHIREILKAAAALNSQELMGHTPSSQAPTVDQPALLSTSSDDSKTFTHVSREQQHSDIEQNRLDMNESDASDLNRDETTKPSAFYSKKLDTVSVSAPEQSVETSFGNSQFYAKRPDHLDIGSRHGDSTTSVSRFSDEVKRFTNIQLSERCKDVHKLLYSDNVSEKPPRSPLSAKRFPTTVKNDHTKSLLASPETITKGFQHNIRDRHTEPLTDVADESSCTIKKRETVETPTQTTDTLLESSGGSMNLSLNVNCSMDVKPRRSSILNVTPQRPWLQEPISPRSYTSVNLTLRPPSTEPQAPIDITSQNSSLTYSTSMFDSQNGLQSRLQITVGPTGSSVSSVRTRPRSSYHPRNGNPQEVTPLRADSLPDLAAHDIPPVIIKQQARLERLRIELRLEKAKLVAVQREVLELENTQYNVLIQKTDIELEKQLQKEIKHLRFQCERLTHDIDRQLESPLPMRVTNEEFYRNIYTGQRGPLNYYCSAASRIRPQYRDRTATSQQCEAEGPKWNCHMCTFQNHPALSKCEQCDMPRILHVSAAPGDNIHIHVTPRISRRTVHSSWVI